MLAKLLKFFQGGAKQKGTTAKPSAGVVGEQRAEEFLRLQRGFSILARNWRNPEDEREEIDLVCRDRDMLVFVEVKARSQRALVPGYYAVNAKKKKILRRAVRAYLARLKNKPATFRFDIVEIGHAPAASGGDRESKILHFENIPLFSKYFRG